MTSHTPIPDYELHLFESLKDIKIVFDVGARADTDYIRLKPEIELHAFEPNPEFFWQLTTAIGQRPNTYVNNYGLGDLEEERRYSTTVQAFDGGEAGIFAHGETYPIKTLDWYMGQHTIDHIDFLKIDVEGYDFKVLLGAQQTIPKCHYIQYEYWNNRQQFHDMLEGTFDMLYFGGRNVLCTNKSWQ